MILSGNFLSMDWTFQISLVKLRIFDLGKTLPNGPIYPKCHEPWVVHFEEFPCIFLIERIIIYQVFPHTTLFSLTSHRRDSTIIISTETVNAILKNIEYQYQHYSFIFTAIAFMVCSGYGLGHFVTHP